MAIDPRQADPRPVAIGPKNAEAMVGHSWRWLREHAEELGVSIIAVGGKRMILADALVAALGRLEAAMPPRERTDAEELEWMRERVRNAR